MKQTSLKRLIIQNIDLIKMTEYERLVNEGKMPRMIDRDEYEEEMRRQKRLPPGQRLTLKFPVLHYGAVPAFDPLSWNFRIFGEVVEEKEEVSEATEETETPEESAK